MNMTMLVDFLGTALECYSCGSLMDFRRNESDCELIYNSYENRNKKMHCAEPGAVCAKYIIARKYNK